MQKSQILSEFCRVCGYHRKYAIRLLNAPPPSAKPPAARRRRPTYGPKTISVVTAIWRAAGYPWSVRLKALLPLWLPWARLRLRIDAQTEQQVLRISPRQIDRRLAKHKADLRRGLYGRTKPGTLLKHQVPVKTDHWDVTTCGYTEIDLVAHCGDCGEGEFLNSLTVTDIHSTWTETRAVRGKGQTGILAAIDQMQRALPFRLRGLDSDNGSEFLNHHLLRYCRARQIQFTRGRPYKKDDNAHVEQKNWTYVRKLIGWDRYQSDQALALLNDLYTNELRLMMNLFQPSVKLVRKQRRGARVTRIYDPPQTPLDRLRSCPEAQAKKVAALLKLRQDLDPFELAQRIETKLNKLDLLAEGRKRGLRVTS